MQSIGALLLKSAGSGQRALNRAGMEVALKVLEYSPLADRAHLLVQGSDAVVQKFVTETRSTDLDRSVILFDVNDTLLDAYLSLHGNVMEDFSLILETSFVGDLLQIAQQGLAQGLKIVELRQFRNSASAGYAIFTGPQSLLSSAWIQDQKRAGEKITVLESLSPGYREFWAIRP